MLALSVLGILGTDTLATFGMEGRGRGKMDEDSSTSSSYIRRETGGRGKAGVVSCAGILRTHTHTYIYPLYIQNIYIYISISYKLLTLKRCMKVRSVVSSSLSHGSGR